MRLIKFRKYELLVSLASFSMLAYLVLNGFIGARGYAFKDKLEQKLSTLKAESVDIVKQREKLESRVTLLRPESIDPDYLDELARKDLYLVKPNDVVVAFQK